MSLLGAWSQNVRIKDISDHIPVWLRCNVMNWGPKPFRTLNAWLEHRDFKGFVDQEWKKMSVTGSYSYVIKEKLKLLKHRLKWWNGVLFGLWI